MTPPQKSFCQWIIGTSRPVVFCSRPVTHYCSESGAQYCADHAEDYSDVFDDDSLKEFQINEVTS